MAFIGSEPRSVFKLFKLGRLDSRHDTFTKDWPALPPPPLFASLLFVSAKPEKFNQFVQPELGSVCYRSTKICPGKCWGQSATDQERSTLRKQTKLHLQLLLFGPIVIQCCTLEDYFRDLVWSYKAHIHLLHVFGPKLQTKLSNKFVCFFVQIKI